MPRPPGPLVRGLLVAGMLGGCAAGTSDPVRTVAPATTASAGSPAVPAGPSTAPAVTGASNTDPGTRPTSTAAPASTAVAVAGAGEERPFEVVIPSGYDGSRPVPLLVLLHGYTSTGELQEQYFGMARVAEEHTMLYVHPDGTLDDGGHQFWNATDSCCNLYGSTVDDAGYLLGVIDEISADFRVDPARVYLVGHSNGGFMSYRMACDHADRIAAIVSLAGANHVDPERCRPSEPVSVLQIHGTNDHVIGYHGGDIFGRPVPPAADTVAAWASYNGCGATLSPTEERRDLEANLDGDDTATAAYDGCPADGAVELWSIEGGFHSPELTDGFAAQVVEFLLDHPKAG